MYKIYKIFKIDKILPVFHKLVEVFFHVLEDEKQLIIFPDDLLQLDDVSVVEKCGCEGCSCRMILEAGSEIFLDTSDDA